MTLSTVPEPLSSRVQQAGWIPLKLLGEGGGGTVFLCAKAALIKAIQDMMFHSTAAVQLHDKTLDLCKTLVLILNNSLVVERDALAALKIPKAMDVPSTRLRLKREVSAMMAASHPALIRLLGVDEGETPEWFVMQCHQRGTLAQAKERYTGQIAEVLLAVRPIAEGVGALHEKGYVHRDIKPNNIFLADDNRLVLGDFGIVFPRGDDSERLTDTGMTLFSRDWVPDWIRFSDTAPQPKVDVFMLAKVIYYMVTGGGKVLASQLDEQEFDLRNRLRGQDGVNELHDFLMGCVTTKEKDCELNSAKELLVRIDEIISQLKGTSYPAPIFSFHSGHSTTNLPIIRNPDENPRYPSLTDIQVLFPRRLKTLRARAKLLGPRSGLKAPLLFKIDGVESETCKIPGLNPDRGTWTEEFRLAVPVPFEAGWHRLDLVAKAQTDGGEINAFVLYGE